MVMPRRLGEGKREKKGRGGSARSKDLGTCREEGGPALLMPHLQSRV